MSDWDERLKNVGGHRITEEEELVFEEELDTMYLHEEFEYNGKKIKTYKDLRTIATSLEEINKMFSVMHEDDYMYIYDWFLWKYIITKK